MLKAELSWKEDLGIFHLQAARPGDERRFILELTLEEYRALFQVLRQGAGFCQSCERLTPREVLRKIVLRGTVKPAPYKWLCGECEIALYTAWDRRYAHDSAGGTESIHPTTKRNP